MEENENLPWELNSNTISLLLIEIMASDNLSYNPLFSFIITLYTLILLYFPQALKLSISPVLIITLTLLLFLLRLGAIQRLQLSVADSNGNTEIEQNKGIHFGKPLVSQSLTRVDKWVASQSAATMHSDPDPKPHFAGWFVEWDVSAPLEVIYEEYEEEEEEEKETDEKVALQDPTRIGGLERYPSLAMYYPETDSDSSSDGGFSFAGEWDSTERFCFKWEEEDREGLLIEIALDRNNNPEKKEPGLDMNPGGFDFEEDTLIEIDVSRS